MAMSDMDLESHHSRQKMQKKKESWRGSGKSKQMTDEEQF